MAIISSVAHRMLPEFRSGISGSTNALYLSTLSIGMSLPVREVRAAPAAPDTRPVLISFPDMLLSTFPCPSLGIRVRFVESKGEPLPTCRDWV